MNIEDTPPHNHCNDCNITFPDSFALIDHMMEEGEEFDPYYLLPSGFKLMLGSMLRFLFDNADDPDQIKLITQSTYVTLFASDALKFEMVEVDSAIDCNNFSSLVYAPFP